MVRLVSTRLMEAGDVVLWCQGKIIWGGTLGSDVGSVIFDTVTFSTWDLSRVNNLIGDQAKSVGVLRAVISDWWH
jgi:hypothetical protein